MRWGGEEKGNKMVVVGRDALYLRTQWATNSNININKLKQQSAQGTGVKVNNESETISCVLLDELTVKNVRHDGASRWISH